MSRTALLTTIRQTEVKVLSREDFDGYDRNYPGPGWELIEYKSNTGTQRAWMPAHRLRHPKVTDHANVVITEKSS